MLAPEKSPVRYGADRSLGCYARSDHRYFGIAVRAAADGRFRQEAETQTIVSQITQNLMEGMLMNPTIDLDSNKKNYSLYMGKQTPLAVDGKFTLDAEKSKAQLAEEQLKRFSYELKNALPDAVGIHYAVCKDSSGKEPTLSDSGVFSSNCDDEANGDTLIKVLWVNDSAGDSDIARTNFEVSGGNIVYTYQARVGGRE